MKIKDRSWYDKLFFACYGLFLLCVVAEIITGQWLYGLAAVVVFFAGVHFWLKGQ